MDTEQETDWRKIRMAQDYLNNLNNRYFNLCVNLCLVPYGEKSFIRSNGAIALATYTRNWVGCKFYDGMNRYGTITFNMESMSKMDDKDILELVRHELAHAIVDQKLKVDNEARCGHGKTWKRVAKLLRVKTDRYCHVN